MAAIKNYTTTTNVPEGPLVKMAKLGVVIERWSNEQKLIGTAIQCWTSLEEFYGVVPCTIMSMSSNNLDPQCMRNRHHRPDRHAGADGRGGKAGALLDWNNNYGTDPDMGVVFHCSNLPKDFFSSQKMDYQEIIAGTVGKENTFGTIVGRSPRARSRIAACRRTT